jgi:hypothetical protein
LDLTGDDERVRVRAWAARLNLRWTSVWGPRCFVGDVGGAGGDADEDYWSAEDDDRRENAVENERKRVRSRMM